MENMAERLAKVALGLRGSLKPQLAETVMDAASHISTLEREKTELIAALREVDRITKADAARLQELLEASQDALSLMDEWFTPRPTTERLRKALEALKPS